MRSQFPLVKQNLPDVKQIQLPCLEKRVMCKSLFHYVQSSHLPTVFQKGSCHITVRGFHRLVLTSMRSLVVLYCVVFTWCSFNHQLLLTSTVQNFVICGVMAQWQINHQVKTKGKMSTKLIRSIAWFCKILFDLTIYMIGFNRSVMRVI